MDDDSRMIDGQLEGYLLGLLTEEDAERIDELSIVDDVVAWELVRAEYDLVDAYVRGELSGARLVQFTSAYVALPTRRDSVRFAEALLLGPHHPSRGADRPSSRRRGPKTAGGAC